MANTPSNPAGGNTSGWETALNSPGLTAEFGQLSHATEDDDSVVRSDQSTVDGSELGEGEDTLQDSLEAVTDAKASSKSEATQKTPGEKEVITVTDETGRKRRVEIDYSNKDAIKRAFASAAGMRKFQAERDREISSRKELEARLQERERDWSNLDQAFKQGHAHLIDTLSGRKGAFNELVEKEIQKREFLRNASPEEKQALKAREEAELTRKELEAIRQENEQFRQKMTQEKEEAELRSVESRVHPVFEKYRFADRLGNSQDEHMFDEMLWNSSMKRLEEYEAKGLDISPELVEREIRAVASAIRRRISVQAEKKVSKVVEQKKQEATENVQARVKSGYAGASDQEKLNKLIQSGDTGSIFKNWSTFSKVLGNRK